ncbi:MAG: WD40 repeat domain-containing protein, partial [Bacteroidales bacterium]|nr:WD40 repeat domain-containing protein [Bacteroidales bacterium]
SDNKGIRRPSNLQSIRTSLQYPAEDLIKVIEAFRAPSISFLTPRYDVPLDDASIIDLSHESLINLWTRLKTWVEEEAESARIYLRLSEYAALYQQGKMGLLKQPELQLALDWREKQKPDLAWARRYNPAFERVIVYLRTSEKEFLEAEERKARLHRWKLKRTRIISSILAGFALVTALLLALAVMGKLSSDARRKDAERQKQEAAAEKALAEEYAALILKRSVEADSVAETARANEMRIKELLENSEKQRLAAEQKASEASRLSFITSRQFDSVINARMASDLDLKVALEQKNETLRLRMISLARGMALRSLQMDAQQDLQALLSYQAYLFNRKNNGLENDPDIYAGLYHTAKLTGNRYLRNFAGHTGAVRKIAFIPGRKEFFTTGEDGRVLKWNLERPDQSMQILYSDSEIIDVLAVSPDANWLACGGRDARIRMLPVNGNYSPYELKGHTGGIKSLIFSYDGKTLYSAALDGKVLKWDLAAKTYTDLSTNVTGITSIDLSASGDYIAGINSDGGALVWRPDRNSDRIRIESPGKMIKSLKFRPDIPVLAVGYDDGNIEMWDITTGKRISEIKAHSSGITDIKFNQRLSQMATASTDGTLKLWDTNDLSGLPVCFNDNSGLVVTIEFSPDGQLLISGTDGKSNNLMTRPAYADLLAADMCSSIKRNFTADEWIAYVGKDIEYEKTCSGLDYNIKIREVR